MLDSKNTNELYHYGVLGMKWGVRRSRVKDAKKRYKNASDKAFKKYEKDIYNLEKNYKRGQTLSKKDQIRESKIESEYTRAINKAKQAYKKAKSDRSNDAKIANRLYSKQNKTANDAVAKMSMGKAFVQSALLGSYGALKYNEFKASGSSTGEAAVKGVLYNWGDYLTGGTVSTVKYLDNRFARSR